MRPSRREFLQTGFAVSILPLAIPHREFTPATWWMPLIRNVRSFYKVVSDVRFAEGDAFANEAERRGASVVRINGDITDFWFNDLSIRWKKGPIPIAGLTAHGPIFCLERFAWDHGLRVVFREENRSESLVRWVIAPPQMRTPESW